MNGTSVRKRKLADIRFQVDNERSRILACQRELNKLKDMATYPYRAMWNKMLMHHNRVLHYEKWLEGRDNWFWVLTGKRFLLHVIILSKIL
jgi:hypothetical protein